MLNRPAAYLLLTLLPTPTQAAPPPLEQAFQTLQSANVIDLTHSFSPTTPHWKGFTNETVTTLYTRETAGFLVQQYCHVGQWGTHIDPPAHFWPNLRTVDQIPPKEMLLRLVVLDIHRQVQNNPDYTVTLQDLADWEHRNGRIPPGAFVALRTDWSKRWPNQAAMQNTDAHGTAHYPGWSAPVLHALYEDRHITASGHETTDTDPGSATTRDDYSLERYVLGTNHYQIEMLTNLDQLPEAGALIIVSFPKPEAGLGFPARVIAITAR